MRIDIASPHSDRVESSKQNLTTDELKTSPSSLDNFLEGVLYGVRNVVSRTGLSAPVTNKNAKNKYANNSCKDLCH